MTVQLQPSKKDDPDFIRLLNSLLDGILLQAESNELYIVAIDNWFDHKWLRFSGIGVVTFEFSEFMHRYDAALDEFWQDRVTLPPLSPNRAISQRYFYKQEGTYLETEPPVLLHSQERQRSERNLQRRIENISDSASFVWYSSNTLLNARASVMCYTVKNADIETWFAAFKKLSGWKLHLTKGIDRNRVQRFLSQIDSVPKT